MNQKQGVITTTREEAAFFCDECDERVYSTQICPICKMPLGDIEKTDFRMCCIQTNEYDCVHTHVNCQKNSESFL